MNTGIVKPRTGRDKKSYAGFRFWVLHFFNYRSHKIDYSEAISQLLAEVDLSDASIIVLDKVERSWKHMAKHVERIHKNIPSAYVIKWGNSEDEKGIQVADAIYGSVSRKFNNIFASDYFDIIGHLFGGYKRIIK